MQLRNFAINALSLASQITTTGSGCIEMDTKDAEDKLNTKSLEEIGYKLGIDQSAVKHDYLNDYERCFSHKIVPGTHIVLLCAKSAEDIATTFATRYPRAEITLILVSGEVDESKCLATNVTAFECKNVTQIHDVLKKRPRPRLILEDGTNTKSQKISLFRELFFYLAHGGLYIVEDLHASLIESLADKKGEDVIEMIFRLVAHKATTKKGPNRLSVEDEGLSNAIRSFESFGKFAVVNKQGEHLYKLRDYEATSTLHSRYGVEWGSEIFLREAKKFQNHGHVDSNRPEKDLGLAAEQAIPDLYIREYKSVLCSARQVALLEDYVLPDSYRHSRARRLYNSALTEVSHRFVRRPDCPAHMRLLNGEFYYLDTEYPSHFGHVSTEVVSRLWGWEKSRLRYPNLKALVSLPKNEYGIPSFQRQMFSAFGISDEDIEFIAAEETVEVETLVAASPQFSNPHWADPEIAVVWDRIRDSISLSAKDTPRKVFVTRPQKAVRSCNNTGAVEKVFERAGFTIFRPELASFEEQVGYFSKAEVIAGFGGSGMFNMMYSNIPGKRIILAGDAYAAKNEFLISAVRSNELTYVWSQSDVEHPPGKWSDSAFRSNFTFDFDRDLKFLIRVLLECGLDEPI